MRLTWSAAFPVPLPSASPQAWGRVDLRETENKSVRSKSKEIGQTRMFRDRPGRGEPAEGPRRPLARHGGRQRVAAAARLTFAISGIRRAGAESESAKRDATVSARPARPGPARHPRLPSRRPSLRGSALTASRSAEPPPPRVAGSTE